MCVGGMRRGKCSEDRTVRITGTSAGAEPALKRPPNSFGVAERREREMAFRREAALITHGLAERIKRREAPLSGAAPFNRLSRGRLFGRLRSRIGGLKPAQNFVGGVLQPCVRLVQLTGSLACQLTELVAIGHMRECLKNKIRTHCESPSSSNTCPERNSWPAGAAEGKPIQYEGCPKLPLPLLRRASACPQFKNFEAVARYERTPYRIGCRLPPRRIRALSFAHSRRAEIRTSGINDEPALRCMMREMAEAHPIAQRNLPLWMATHECISTIR